MSETLKPCPFCGSEPFGSGWNADHFTARVHCGECGARGPIFDSHDEAISAWNTRADLAEAPRAPLPEPEEIKAFIEGTKALLERLRATHPEQDGAS